MRKQLFLRGGLFTILSLIFTTAPLFAQTDVAGSKDHPLITRYPNATIGWYDEEAFQAYHIAIGDQAGYRRIDDWQTVEGKVTRIYYVVDGIRTMTEIYRNYKNALARAGFKTMAEGLHPERNVKKTIGGGTWLGTAYTKNPYPPSVGIQLMQGSATSQGGCYIATKLDRPDGTVYAVLAGHQYKADKNVFLLDIIEVAAMDDGLIKADADYIAREIEMNGTASIYGVLFDFDKATIQAASEEALGEIAKYLNNYPTVQLYVVGHTDMKGALGYNMDLSQRRAAATVEALVTKYGIARNRLIPKGVGPLAPKSNNTSDKGRQFNRRVELVKRVE